LALKPHSDTVIPKGGIPVGNFYNLIGSWAVHIFPLVPWEPARQARWMIRMLI